MYLLGCPNGYTPEELICTSRRRIVDIFLATGFPFAMEILPVNSVESEHDQIKDLQLN